MPILDFKEIQSPTTTNGEQDSFELFAREFLHYMGYIIVANPSRGADGGVDLIVEELRTGISGETRIKWLVSCKHYSTSGKSIGVNIEDSISDRVKQHQCQGFLGFYSTLASSSLHDRLRSFQSDFEYNIYDKEYIERELLKNASGIELAKRFFPKSITIYQQKAKPQGPNDIFSEKSSLKCDNCSKELLSEEENGIIVFYRDFEDKKTDGNWTRQYRHVFWVCKGACDRKINKAMYRTHPELTDSWEDINALKNPTIYAEWMMALFNKLRRGDTYSDEAFDRVKEFMLRMYPFICREQSENETEDAYIKSLVPKLG